MAAPARIYGKRGSAWALGAAVVIGLLALVQLWRVFSLRMDYGDVYPAYSTHRADPMGAQAFYESLAMMPGLQVRRHERNIMELNQGNNTTLFLAGVPDTDDPMEVIRAAEGFVLTGGRMVIAYYPLSGVYWKEEQERAEREKTREGESEKEAIQGEKELYVNIKERWGFEISGKAFSEKAQKIFVNKKAEVEELPDSLPWRSASYFEKLADHWRVVYARDDFPVIIERQWGSGSIVVCADSYFISNEALRKERPTGFLTWLVGPNTQIVVDESHFGIVHTPGLMDLVRRYRLDLALIAFAVTGLLFVWKSMWSLVPRHDAAYLKQTVESENVQEAFTGLHQLVRRSVPVRRLLTTCYEEWRRDFAHDPRFAPAAHNDIMGLAQDTENNAAALVARYKTMERLIKERK
ncbi:MAG TPA: DUF4350 domain-containing protein [Candidatus Hydrogenedentes bacterium]|nr:DUF4350 domain-containing protein [Candidatus Hydrogenedentota bacterium]